MKDAIKHPFHVHGHVMEAVVIRALTRSRATASHLSCCMNSTLAQNADTPMVHLVSLPGLWTSKIAIPLIAFLISPSSSQMQKGRRPRFPQSGESWPRPGEPLHLVSNPATIFTLYFSLAQIICFLRLLIPGTNTSSVECAPCTSSILLILVLSKVVSASTALCIVCPGIIHWMSLGIITMGAM
jgi:hypothetical protein